jgi:hypothetical protein
MPLLVTSASGASGNGFGALLAFELDGSLRGNFIDDDRTADPLGFAVDSKENLLFLTRHSRNQTGKSVTMPEWASNS